MSEWRLASTGSAKNDDTDERHEGRIESSQEVVAIPGVVRCLRIVLDGISYTHVGVDADGRWTYRAV